MELDPEEYLISKGRMLPELSIEGTLFIFDIDTIALFEKQNPNNIIYFDMMHDYGSHYGFTYSPMLKNQKQFGLGFGPDSPWTSDGLFDASPSEINRSLRFVEIPRIGKIDPMGMSLKYKRSPIDIVLKSDFEIMVDQKIFNQRITGAPVTIDFPGKKYEIDVANNLLKPDNGIGENINLNELRYDYFLEDQEVYHLFYNVKEGKVEDPPRDGTWDKCEDRIILEIPLLETLDPVGRNRALHWESKQALMYYPDLRMSYQATVVPWTEYGIDQSIEKSLKSLPEKEAWISSALKDEKIQNKANVMERELPELIIGGTCFLVDVDRMELKEKNNPENIISVFDMRDLGIHKGYSFEYSISRKNFPSLFSDEEAIWVTIPEMLKLDPERMSEKYGVPLAMLASRSDFDLMVDQTAYKERITGFLPTVEIEGYTFYVDVALDMLRPKDDLGSKGIVLSEIEDYYVEETRSYQIPYNPKTHEFQEYNFRTITQIPNDVIIVSLPHECDMDPIGFNRKHGFDETFMLKETNIKSQFMARQIDWKDTAIEETIKENKVKLLANRAQIPTPTIRKGRKL